MTLQASSPAGIPDRLPRPGSRESEQWDSQIAGARAPLHSRRLAPCSHRGRDCRSESKLPPRDIALSNAKWKVERPIYIPANLPVVPLLP